jgi:hypothetical protein
MLIILLKLNSIVFSQTDTSKIKEPVKCINVTTLKRIAEDLVKGDSALAELKISSEHILKLEEKIILKDSIIVFLTEKENNNKIINGNLDQKIIILEKYNETLTTELKKVKTKNKFKNLLSNTLIVSLLTLLILR